jgi:hypothetical protein
MVDRSQNSVQPRDLADMFMFCAGLWVLIASWLGYHTSINAKAIKGDARFILDIVLLVLYIFLLLTFRSVPVVAILMGCISIVYVCWDYFKTAEYPQDYYGSDRPPWIDQYLIRCARGWWNWETNDRLIGGIVNVGWAIFYVLIIPFSFLAFFATDGGKFVFAVILIISTILYRYDKQHQGFWICLIPVRTVMPVMFLYAIWFLVDVYR